ncbi:MAG: tetratricopeptide repeat protein [Terriglobales bacterium]
MALGFGFNKAKVLSSAEKYVQQGKMQNAIGEYEKVAKEDPKDLTVLNTIGDLYARLGQPERATAFFRRVGDAYAADGFTVKAIAMYKKLTKLTPHSIDGLQKLAELYTQQGLYNDARQQYVALADHWMRANDLDGAARVFQKMLELDPENAAMQTKLADLYIRMGKREDAKEIYFRAAESLFQRGAMDAADEALGRILSIDPANTRALLKRGLIAADSGDGAAAIQHLQRIQHLDTNPEALGVLLRAHLQVKDFASCEKIARDLAAEHNNLSGIQALAETLLSSGSIQPSLALYKEFSGQLSHPESLQHALDAALQKVNEDAPSLEIIREMYGQIGDKAHYNETTEQLAHTLVHAGELTRARDLYRELTESEPENPIHQQHYRQVLAKLGEDPAVRTLTSAEGEQAFMVDELQMTAHAVAQEYPVEIAEVIEAALTDSDLLESYNMPAKAVAPLEAVLPKAPRDFRISQRLASLYAAANRFADAANCCDTLHSIYVEAGYGEEAQQYSDLAAKYRERARTAPPMAHAAPASASLAAEVAVQPRAVSVQVEPAVVAPAFHVEPAVVAPAAAAEQEIDISDEWEAQATEPAAKVVREQPAPSVADLLEEIRFYISQGMWNEARVACERCQRIAPGNREVVELEAKVSAALAPVIEVEGPADFGISMETAPAVASMPAPAPAPAPAAKAAAAKANVLGDFVSDLEQSLGSDFAPAAAASSVPAKVVAAPAPSPAPVVSAPVAQVAAVEIPEEVKEEANTVLTDMFAEFKEDAEAGSTEVEDPETHYNLGVAFREMGLMDEAIGELQKVCLAIDGGAPFSQTMQAYTWLAQCLVDKGVPGASFKWYERALKIATDEHQRMSLHYDLAAAYEASGDRPAAMKHFMEVYGSNIDYRDVAERIKALRS